MAGKNDNDEGVETRKVSKDEAAFILGGGGKTKAKLCVVSGASIEVTETRGAGSNGSITLQIKGTARQRKLARKYVEFVVAQRLGPVQIEDPSAHDDLTILVVPADTVSFITGKQGSFLRLVEEEWGALLFFLQVNPKNPPKDVAPGGTERLAIFGGDRNRRGAQLKVMAAIEMKMPLYFTKSVGDSTSPAEGFATDTVIIKEDDYSYALGRTGSTRKKLARASSCIVEYVGRVAYFCGNKPQRERAKEYLMWLLQQRVGTHVHVQHKGRDDVTLIMVPSSCIGFVTGHKGTSLRNIEEETNTFCFIDGMVDDGEDMKPLLIFGCVEDRRNAETLVWEKISHKYDEVMSYDNANAFGKKGKSKGKGKGKDGKARDYGKNDYASSTPEKSYNSQGWGAPRPAAPEKEHKDRVPGPNDGKESMTITDEDAAFLMGPGGKTKRKVTAVSGAELDLKPHRLDIIGSPEEREKAKKYVSLIMAQRLGPVKIDNADEHEDLSIIDVPAEAVSFVTGKQGSFLRLVEEEFGTMLFFIDFNKSNRRDQVERLAVFGPLRERRGAELKVMAAIEMKQPGYFTKKDALLPMQDPEEGFATDRMAIDEEDYSYALGKGGATRKKIARASQCVIEYIGRLAYLSGVKKERRRAREYLGWLFRQRVGPVEVDFAGREDVTVLNVPKDCVGFVTGHKGTSLRAIEEATGTFCFIEGGRDDPVRDPKPLLVFGSPEARKNADELLRKRIDLKLVEGWVHEDQNGGSAAASGYNNYSYNSSYNDGKAGKSRGDAGKKPKGSGRGYGPDGHGTGLEAAAPQNGDGPAILETMPEDDNAWGDWGGDSDEEQTPAAASARAAQSAAEQRANLQLLQTTGRWSGAHSMTSHAPSHSSATQQRGGGTVAQVSAATFSPSRIGEELELPPQLLHEEAWPELGMMGGGGGGAKRGKK